MLISAAPALTKRPFGVGLRPTLHCGEHGPRRLSELTAHGTNRGHVLALECGAQWSLRCALRSYHPLFQSVATNDGAFEGALLDVELADVEVRSVAQHRKRDPGQTVGDRDGRHLVAALRSSPDPRLVMRPYASRSPE